MTNITTVILVTGANPNDQSKERYCGTQNEHHLVLDQFSRLSTAESYINVTCQSFDMF